MYLIDYATNIYNLTRCRETMFICRTYPRSLQHILNVAVEFGVDLASLSRVEADVHFEAPICLPAEGATGAACYGPCEPSGHKLNLISNSTFSYTFFFLDWFLFGSITSMSITSILLIFGYSNVTLRCTQTRFFGLVFHREQSIS